MTTTGRRVLATVLAAQALRGLGYGLAAVQLSAVLRGQGLDAPAVGLVLAAIVAGSAAASLALGRWGDRFGRARSYGLLYGALIAAGLLIAAGAPAWLLALVALSGALSTEVVESGPFTTLEQVMLASTGAHQPQVVQGFGVYNAVATVAGAAGALLGTLPANQRLVGGTLALVGVAGALLAGRLPASVEAPATEGAGPRRPLASSRRPVLRLAGLFAVDSLAGGLVVQAWIAYWLGVRYGAPTRVVGVVFAAIGLLQAASFLAAPAIANRVGLLPTMGVHPPAVQPAAGRRAVGAQPAGGGMAAVGSHLPVADGRAHPPGLCDGPGPPAERTAAAAVANTARYVTRPVGPALAGLLQPLGLGIPFLVAGVVKSAYDLALWRLFRPILLPADIAAMTGGAA